MQRKVLIKVMLAKYIDKYNVQYANNKQILKYKDKQIINPKEEDYIIAGYKELIKGEISDYDEETEYLEISYELKDEKIYEHYDIKKIEESE